MITAGISGTVTAGSFTEIRKAAELAAGLFAHNEWTWSNGQVPDVDQIEAKFVAMIRDAVRDAEQIPTRWGTLSTGRLYVRVDEHVAGARGYDIELGIKFGLR